ncbi:MAG: T9SS type A sorting domain-containing protein [Chitinophagales bacterium]|nr:T9SS type A sorting domain-containing protein [Chitinophagales bacterium]
MYKFLFLCLTICGQVTLHAQATFFKSIHNGNLHVVSPTPDGGVIAGGDYIKHTSSEDIHRGILIKLDAEGNVEWRRHFPEFQKIRGCITVSDGYMITGDYFVSGDQFQVLYFARLDMSGNVVWAQKINNQPFKNVPYHVFELPDGGFVLHGGANVSVQGNCPVMYRTDAQGNVLWSKIIKTSFPTFHGFYQISAIQGDTLFATGQIQGNGIFLRVNAQTGEVIGVSSMGGIYMEGFLSMVEAPDKNFLLAGMTRSTTDSEEERPWIIKVDRTGQLIWSKTYNLPGWNQICELAGTGDGGGIFTVSHNQGLATPPSIFARIDSLGNLVWAYNYTSGFQSGLRPLTRTTDNGYVALDLSGKILKINEDGRTFNGCCPVPIQYQVTDYNPPIQTLSLFTTDWLVGQPYSLKADTDTLLYLENACETSMATIATSIPVCQGKLWEFNGQQYAAPNVVRDTVISQTGGCDTLYVYNLLPTPRIDKSVNLSTCPGQEIVFNGVTYTQPVSFSYIAPATVGCDTFVVVNLRFDQWPKKYQITQICAGDTVYFNGLPYTHAITIFPPDTIAGPPNGCDTLLFQKLDYPDFASTITLKCPENISVQTSPGKTVPVFFDNPEASTTCPCDTLVYWLASGLPSGSDYAAGTTEVCLVAGDYCNALVECCFTVEVTELEACDVKQSGPIAFELLDVSNEPTGDITYRMRIRNESAIAVDYLAFELPDGANAQSPVHGSIYHTQADRTYGIKNPSASPFTSIRFKAVNPLLANGLEDIFTYTIPSQYAMSFIQCVARLVDGDVYEAKWNTFNCQELANRLHDRNTGPVPQSPAVQIFPNPSNGALSIQWSGKMEGDFVIKDLMGRALHKYSFPADKQQIKIQLPENLVNGLYILEIKMEGQETQLHKFVLERI